MRLLGAHGDGGDETTEQIPARLLCDAARRGGRGAGNGPSAPDAAASLSSDDTQLCKKLYPIFSTLLKIMVPSRRHGVPWLEALGRAFPCKQEKIRYQCTTGRLPGCFPTLNRNGEISEKPEDPKEALSPIQTAPERDPDFLEFLM